MNILFTRVNIVVHARGQHIHAREHNVHAREHVCRTSAMDIFFIGDDEHLLRRSTTLSLESDPPKIGERSFSREGRFQESIDGVAPTRVMCSRRWV
jgi:hypothetical protein